MRKRLRILLLATVVAALIVPFGFALSNEGLDRSGIVMSRAAVPVPFNDIERPGNPAMGSGPMLSLPRLSEGAKLFVIGTALFAVAAAMRRSG
jgi:hypothetical protein